MILDKCRREMREILVLRERYETIRASLLPRAIKPTPDRVQVSAEDYFTGALAAELDLEKRINKKMDAMMKTQLEAQTMIDDLPDDRQRNVLTLYYLTFNKNRLHTWETVAETLNYSVSHVKNIRNQAKTAILKKDNTK